MAARSSGPRATSANASVSASAASARVPWPARVEGVHHRHAGLPRHGREGLALGRIADEQRRLGIAEEVGDLGRRVGGVQRQEHRAGPDRAEIQEQDLRALLDLHRDPVPGLHAAAARAAA